MRNVYHRKGVTDLEAFRNEAIGRLKDRRYPEDTVIHYHDSVELCEHHTHELVYLDGDKEDALIGPLEFILRRTEDARARGR